MDTWTRTCLGIIGIGGCEYATEPVMLSKKVPRDWDDMLGGESACSLSENREKSVCRGVKCVCEVVCRSQQSSAFLP
jgi:hypothetical protein